MTNQELLRAFEKIPLLAMIPKAELEGLMEIAELTKSPSGKFLARAGKISQEIFFIREGGARVCEATPEGKEITIALHGPGTHIGMVSMVTSIARTSDVIATCRCELIRFEASAFRQALKRSPVLTFHLMTSLAHRLEQTSRHMAHLALYNLDRRLALRLLELAVAVDWNGEERLLVRERPSHQELANMLGSSREAITRSLRHLEDAGHIEVADDQVFVISSPS